ncbi:hypothetical protein AAVH_14120 [Aphelenchoides avenae]|nr:hypothetical protein AAVH_14120 [Aphelenchus avenae]
MARRRIGGTVILNVECPPSDDVVLTDISRSAADLRVPFTRGILPRLFREKIGPRRPNPGHDGALLITLLDEHTFTWRPMIHSNQLALPTFSGDLGDRGLRHHSALCLSQLTSAIIFVVSKDHRSISVYRHGQAHLDLNADQVSRPANISVT